MCPTTGTGRKSSRTQSKQLPVELIAEIIAIIANDTSDSGEHEHEHERDSESNDERDSGFSTLAASSLVSVAWNTICRPHIFRTIIISYDSANDRLSFLHFEAPHLSEFIRELRLGWNEDCCTASEWLPECFGRLKNLGELHLEQGISNLSIVPAPLAEGIVSMLAAPRLRKLDLCGWGFAEDGSDLLSMLTATLETLSLEDIMVLDMGVKKTLPPPMRLEALRSLHLLDVFHPMLQIKTFIECPNLERLSVRWYDQVPWDLPSWIPASLSELTLVAARECNIPSFEKGIRPSVVTINLTSSHGSYIEIFTWVTDCVNRLPFPNLIQELTIDISNSYYLFDHANTEDHLPKTSDYAMLSQFLRQLFENGKLKSIVLGITVGIDYDGVWRADEAQELAKLETGFAELLKANVLDVDFNVERWGEGEDVIPELVIHIPRAETK